MWRVWVFYGLWLGIAAVNAGAQLCAVWYGFPWLIFPVAAGGIMFGASASFRLFLGRWLDYRPAFRMLLSRRFRERMIRSCGGLPPHGVASTTPDRSGCRI